MKTETLESLGVVGNRISLGAAATTVWAWVTSNEFMGFLGAAVAIGGLIVTWFYKREASKRQARESNARLRTEELRAQREQLRIDLMRTTGQPVRIHDDDSDLAPLEADE